MSVEPFNILSKLVSIDSAYPNENKLGDFIYYYLKKRDFNIKKQRVSDNRFNILAEKGSGPSILFFGHLDTILNQEGWDTNPYVLSKKDNRLYGLGAWDMKAGLAAMLLVADYFKSENFCLKLAFLVDEENFSQGANYLIKDDFLKNIKGAVTSEPGFLYGLDGASLGRVGRAVFKITINTDGGHVYLAKQSNNAITESCKILSLINNLKMEVHPQLGESLIFPRLIHSNVDSMVLPNRAVLEIECQLVPPQSTKWMFEYLRSTIAKEIKRGAIKASVEIDPIERPTPFSESYIANPKSNFIKQILKIHEEFIGKKSKVYYRRSVGDENVIANSGIDILTIGPNGGNAHQANEWVSKQSLEELVIFYKILLDKFPT